MIPIGSSSSRTRGRLVMERAFPVVGYRVAEAKRLPHASPGNVISGNGLTEWGGAEWLLRHVYRRVQLTLGLRCRETGARLPPAAAHDLPTTVLGMQRFRGERDHLGCRGAGEDHVHAAGAGAQLQLGEQRVSVARTRRREGGGIDDH